MIMRPDGVGRTSFVPTTNVGFTITIGTPRAPYFVMDITSDGEEGYQYYAAHQNEVDLILMDLHMPVMDGYAASDMIRKSIRRFPSLR